MGWRCKWAAWYASSIASTGLLGSLLAWPEGLKAISIERTLFLPGDTTDGHYQIELACESCHREPFTGPEQMQNACVSCHGAELDRADDSHPPRKFTDPRNADRVAVLDARWCVTCHREHRPEITSPMGLSLPVDYCYRCHATIGEDRPTHRGLPFSRCASSGCHNFHDNRALYEDFLVAHREEPYLKAPAAGPARALRAWARERGFAGPKPLRAEDHDGPPALTGSAASVRVVADWAASAHASGGVNCRGCHQPAGAAWNARPLSEACRVCHAEETRGFRAGRHGMRSAARLSPMRPELARIPMREDAAHRLLTCNTCHPAHAHDTRRAAVEACLGCHADRHSLAYEGSPHDALWRAETSGMGTTATGVSCATCHLPRVRGEEAPSRILVAHNQNDYLRPNEKMIRSVCMNCHGLSFSMNALADRDLIESNFRGLPTREVESIHFASILRWKLEGRHPPWEREQPKPVGKEEARKP